MGFTQLKSDPCILVLRENKEIVFILGKYSDDIQLAGDPARIEWFLTTFQEHYKIDDRGSLTWILGIEVIRHEDAAYLTQKKYIMDALTKFGMVDCKPMSTPMSTTCNLDPVADDFEIADKSLYRSIIGSLLWIANCTRPDIAYAVNRLAQSLNAPGEAHLTAAKRVLRYLKGTKDYVLCFKKQDPNVLQVYSDASYASAAKRRSTSGVVLLLNSNVVIWKSRKQSVTAQSTVEAEYIALCLAAKETAWI